MLTTRENLAYKRIWASLIPYIVIGIGLFVLHNAWITIVGYHLSMVIILSIAERKLPFRQIIKSANNKIPAITVVLGLSGGLFLYLFWPSIGIPEDINAYLQNIVQWNWLVNRRNQYAHF